MQFMIRGNPIIKYFLSAVLGFALLGATQVHAQVSPTMTQVEFIQWLVQLSGDGSSLPQDATANDYVAWAINSGIVPPGGWSPNSILTRDVLAQALVQFFNLKVKKGSDPLRTLQREGINLPGLTEEAYVTRKDFVTMMDVDGFQPRANCAENKKHTKHKTPPHKPPKPPKPPKQKVDPQPDKGNGPKGKWWDANGDGNGAGNGWGNGWE